ncbi:mucin-binding protein, partial [Lactobacillus intestinalis]|uniref:mucin-binding protein n=1 Tax=Lactobacillus intestinalis TaxID=151781 RepID=UPI0025A97D76
MVSKNNRIKKMENAAERQSHFGIRKLTIGAASVLLGTTLWMNNGNVVQASDNGNDGNKGDKATNDSKTETPQITDDTKVVIEKSDDAAKAAQAQSQNQTNDNAQSQEAQADQNKVESSALEKAQTESAQADTSVQQTQQNTEKSAKSDKDQTTKDQVAENAKEALEVQKQKAETVTNSNSKTSTETINKEASAESAKQSSAQEATKAAESAESAESNVTKAIDNSNATLATTNEVAAASQTLKTAGIQGNTNQKDNKSNDNTVSVDLSKLGVTGTTDKGIQKTSFAVKRLLSANTQNLESNEVNVQQFSPQALASLFTTSLVQTSGSGSNDATDIDTYKPNFNITENPEYQQYFAAIPADQYAFQSYEVVSTGQKIVVTTDKNDIGNNIRFYNVRNGSAQLVYQISRNTQMDGKGTVKRDHPSLQGTYTTAGVASGSTYQGGTYHWSLNQANSVNFAGLGNLKIGRIDITSGNNNSPVDNGTGAFVTDDAHRITITWDQGRPISDSIIPGKTWNSAGSNIPDKVTQNIWYVDAETGNVLSHKVSDEAYTGSSYDSTSNELETITKNGKTYQLVARDSDGLYNSSDFTDILNKQLTTNNGVPITVGDLLSTPLKGILGDGRIGNIRASITNYQGTRSYTRLQTKTDGTIDLNTYLFDAGSTKGTLIPGLSQANVAPGQTVMGAHLADTGSGAFYNGTKPGNRDIIILYKAATPVANKQNANITFVNDDTGASLSPQQDATGDAGSQISFANAGTTVANLIGQGYIYNGTTGNGVTNGSASGSFTSVGFPVYDNDNNTNQAFVVHFKNPVQTPTYHQGVEESKTIHRTINYYDKVTREKIPSNLISQNPVTDSVTFTRTQILDQDGKFVGYGTISADGKSILKRQDWHTADGESSTQFNAKPSSDLSAFNYTAPEFQNGDNASIVAAHDVTPDTQDLVYNVYYGHQTKQVTTNEDVTRRFHYIFTDGTTPESHLTPQADQKVSFTGTATKDLVTGKTGDTVWSPSTGTLAQVAGQAVADYHITGNVNANADGSANAVTVNPDSGDIDVTIVYTPDAKTPDTPQKAKVTIYDKTENNTQLAAFENNKGTKGSAISFDGEPQTLQAYLNSGYVFDSATDANGNSIGTASSINFGNFDSIDGNVQSFNIYLVHGTDTKTEKATTNAQVHYVVADNGVQAPKDSDLQTITYTKTNKVDKVTGAIVNEGEWKADKSAFTDVTSPDLSKDGYTPSLENVQFNAPERNVNQRVTVVYNRSAQAADLQIIDDNDPQNQRVLATYSAGGESGKQISFDGSNTQLQNYLKNGYTFEKSEGQGMSGDSQNGFTYPSFDNDSKTNQSFKIYLKHATGEKKETATTTAHVHYIMADGTKAPDDSATQTISWSRTNTVDQVTGAVVTEGEWKADKNTFTDVDSPAVTGYTPGTKTVKFATPERGANQVVDVVYTKDAPTPDTTTGKVTYIDDTAKTTLKTDSLSGNVGANIDYTTQGKINNYINMGYKLVSNNFTDGKEVFNKDAAKNNFEVHLVHDTVPVTPDNPGTPDKPINPKDPRPKDEQPKYPTGTGETDLTKDITRTVHYEGADQYTPNDVQQPVHFTAKGVLDKVTGQWTTPLTWSGDQTFNGVTTPKIPGYHVVSVDKDTTDNQNVDSAKISHTGANYTVTVKYAKDDVPTPIKQGTIEVIYHDTTDNVDIPGYGRTQTKEDEGTSYSYNPNDKDLPALENKGYVLDGKLPTIPTKYTDGDQRVVINVKHGTRPVTPENPANPTDPVDPQHPGTPTPSNPNLSKTDLEKSITRTVKYQYADGTSAHDDSVQTVDFKGQGIIDLVTGNLVNVDKDGNIVDQRGKITWDHDSKEFGNVDAINHDGYYVSNVSETNTSAQVTDTAVAKETVTPSSQNSTIVITLTKNPEAPKTQQNAQLTIRDVTPGQEQDLGSYTQPGLEGDAISFGNAQEFVQNLLNKGYVWDGASYNGTNLDATNYAGIKFGNYDNTDDKNDISQKWVINLVHGVTPVNPDHPDDKDGYTKKYLDRTITRDVTYVDEQGNEMPGLTREHQEAKFQGSGYLDNVTGKWVTVENGKITGLAQGLTWTPDKDANFDAIAAKTAEGYHVVSVSGNGISGFTVSQDGAVTAQTVSKDTPSSTIKVVYAKTPVTPVPANGSIVYIDDTTGNTLENANFGGNVGDKINYTTADRIANYEKKGYNVVSNNFHDGQETFTNGENKFEVHLVHATTPITPENPGKPGQEVPNLNDPNNPHTIPDNFVPQTLTKTVTRDVTYVYEDGSQAETPVHQTFTFNGNGIVDLVTGQLVTVENGKITGAGKITWNADNHDFDATKAIDTTQYNIVKVSENNTSANVDMSNGVVASETINPNSQNSKVVITLAKKEAPTPADQTVVGKQVVHYVDEQGNKLRDDNTNDTFVFTKPGKTGQWNETSHKYADANAVVIDGYVSDQKTYEGQTATPEDANKEITIVYHKIGKIIPVDPSGNPIPDAPTPGYHNDPNDPSKVTPNEPTPNIPGWTTDVPNVTPEVPTKDTNVPYTKNPDTPVPANGSIVYIDDTTGNNLENATFSGNVGDKINYTTADRITNYTNKGYKLVSNNFKDGSETFVKDGNKFEVHFVHDTVPVTPTDPGKPGQPINPNDPNGPKYPDGTGQTDLTKTVTRTINYVGDGLNIPASHTEIEFTGSGVLDKVTGQWTTPLTWTVKGGDSDSGNFEQVDGPKADGYYITNISSSNEDLGDIDSTTGTVASKTINHANGNIVITINYAKKTTPTPADQTVVGKQVVHYVDEQGNKLRDDNTNETFVFTKPGKTGQWNETSHKYADANAVVIDGYVSDQKTYEGQTATPEDANKEITIVYHKIGKIIPVDPSGNPIPDVPTPGYHNDPNDPSKVTPNEPTPNIPGWTTDVPNVTPEVPTKDTNVPYTKNPDTPVPANGSIVYIDDTTGN